MNWVFVLLKTILTDKRCSDISEASWVQFAPQESFLATERKQTSILSTSIREFWICSFSLSVVPADRLGKYSVTLMDFRVSSYVQAVKY